MAETYYDPVAAMDQASENAKQVARPIVAFYQALTDADMDTAIVHELTIMWAQKILAEKRKG